MKKTIASVLAGSVGAQLVGLLSILLLSSYYDKNEFAEYGVFFAISAIIGNFTSLKLGNFIFSIEKDSILKITKFLILLTPVLFIISFPIIFLFTTQDNRLMIYLSLFNGLAIGLYDYFYACSVRFSKTKTYSTSRFLRICLELLAVIIVTFNNYNISYFMFFCAISYLLTALFCYQSVHADLIKLKTTKKINFHNEIKLIIYDFFASIFNVVSIYLPILYFYFSKDEDYSTAFFLVTRFVGVPVLLIAQSIGIALKQHAIEEYEKNGTCTQSVNYIWKNFIKKLWPIYVTILLLGYLSAYFFSPIFGGIIFLKVVLIILPLYFFRYLFNCIAAIVYILSMQKINMYYQLILLIFPGFSLFFFEKPFFSLIGYSLSSIIVYFIYFNLILKKSQT